MMKTRTDLPKLPTIKNDWIPVLCEIRSADIEAMDYWLNECGVADAPSQNAVSFGLKRLLLPGVSVRVQRKETGELVGMVDGETAIPIPQELSEWYSRALLGHCMKPISVKLAVPKELVSRRVWNETGKKMRPGNFADLCLPLKQSVQSL